jgi:hypothetical protein
MLLSNSVAQNSTDLLLWIQKHTPPQRTTVAHRHSCCWLLEHKSNVHKLIKRGRAATPETSLFSREMQGRCAIDGMLVYCFLNMQAQGGDHHDMSSGPVCIAASASRQ